MRSALAVGRAEDVALRRHHHLIEVLGEHGGGEEGNRTKRLVASVLHVMTHRRRQHEDATGPNRQHRAILEIELARAGNNVLRLFGRVGVPAEALAGLDLLNDDGRRHRTMPTIDGEGTLPVDSL